MVSNLRRVRRDYGVPVVTEPKRFTRIDDPELALEVAARREKNTLSAMRAVLPAVGSKLVNRYGLEFEVESHIHVPTANSVQRWREGSQSEADLFPSIVPQNLSQKLTSFVAAVDRCTSKTLVVLDTMPHARRDAGVPDGHWVDTIGNGGANLLFIDAAQINEAHFAHEIGHLWVQYVDQAEDERVMEDVSDAGRLHQLSFVQSFVTDLRVNQIIAQKGFDVSVIVQDQAASIASLGRAIEAGYRPENPREGVFMALALAVQILEDRKSSPSALAKLDDTLEKVTRLDPELARLAFGFADAVMRHGYDGKDQIRASIDECLNLAFDYSGDGFDLERDLVIPSISEPSFDKYPQWIEGASPQMKTEVGRIMAREDIPDGSRWSIRQGPLNTSLLSFELPDGTIKGPWTLEHSQAFAAHNDHIQRITEMNRQNRERQMKHKPNGMPSFPGQPRRFYMAGAARFLTRVREAEWLGGEDPYAYAMNNPVKYTDPTGHKPQECPTHRGGDPGCIFNGPAGSQSDPAFWNCQSPPPGGGYNFWSSGIWGYGGCCGPTRKCGPASKTFNCTDVACKEHDICVGPNVGSGVLNWLPCNEKFCNDIKYCWNLHCRLFPADGKQCAAIRDIAGAFCNRYGGGPPQLGNQWR